MRKLQKAVHKIYSGSMGEGGFTLIELLVVVGIMAALAGVVTLSVTQFIGRGKCEACKTEIHNCQTAVAAWMVDHTGDAHSPCSYYVGTTLLTTFKYGAGWAVSTGGVVSGDCTSITGCTP
jgi:prepilin-type N-terminal cleavage/methylation domain-containing protein